VQDSITIALQRIAGGATGFGVDPTAARHPARSIGRQRAFARSQLSAVLIGALGRLGLSQCHHRPSINAARLG
jgi:hypothetical protein